MTATTPGCPAIHFLQEGVANAAAQVAGVRAVDIVMTFDPHWTPSRIEPIRPVLAGLCGGQLSPGRRHGAYHRDQPREDTHQGRRKSRRRQVALIVVSLRLIKVGSAGICDISKASPVSSEVQSCSIGSAKSCSSPPRWRRSSVLSPAVADDVTVRQAWSRATPKGAKVAGGYLAIENRGIQPDRLLSASSGAAAKVEIHQMSMQDGIMTMRSLDDGLAIPPDATVTLALGGDHIMFIGLIAPFEEGQTIPVSLNFERAGKIEAGFEVGSVGAKGPRLQIASTEPAAAGC